MFYMLTVDVRSNVLAVERKLDDFALRQMPFAVATALTMLAKDVQDAEKKSLPRTFDKPTPFTVNSIRIIPAKKNLWQAEVFVMDKAAEYLYPYEVGGLHKLIGKGITWLEPAQYGMLNAYGNFPKNTLARLKAQRSVFVGTVATKVGKISGVWQRIDKSSGKKSPKGRGLKLLIKFGDAHPARQHLDFGVRGERVIRANFNKRMGAALARAIATAKP